jgi:hypothetical protein
LSEAAALVLHFVRRFGDGWILVLRVCGVQHVSLESTIGMQEGWDPVDRSELYAELYNIQQARA